MRLRDELRVLAAVVVLVAGACGDDDDADSAANDGGSGRGGADFCDRAGEIYQQLLTGGDFTQERFEGLRTAMEGIDPPDAVADDWRASIDAMGTLADQGDIEALDLDDPAIAEALERATTAQAAIGDYLTDQCGQDLSL